MEVKGIRFESVLAVEKIGFGRFISTRDTHTEHVLTPKKKIKNRKKGTLSKNTNNFLHFIACWNIKADAECGVTRVCEFILLKKASIESLF